MKSILLVLGLGISSLGWAADEAAVTPVAATTAGTEYELADIVSEGTPRDIVTHDPIVPTRKVDAESAGATGSLGRELQRKLPIAFTDNGNPGGLTQARGNGRSAEDIGVDVLGVPLNLPQGGGFDFSTFPQYLWSEYSYQNGPISGPLDPRAVAGRVGLTPWTAAALRGDEDVKSFGAFGQSMTSSLGQYHLAVGGRAGKTAAAIAGYSAGQAQGPAGALSAQARWGATRAQFHFLGASLDVLSPGSATYPTPGAHQKTSRLIPMAVLDQPLGEGNGRLKTSLFYDVTNIAYTDPSSQFPMNTSDQARQGGAEVAWTNGQRRIAAGLRSVTYNQSGFQAPVEEIGHLTAGRTFDLPGNLALDVVAQAGGVSRFGLYPAGSVGLKRDWETQTLWAKGSLSKRIPSLSDRYYELPGYRANPSLGPETDWTTQAGWKLKLSDAVAFELEALAQWRNDAQVRTTNASNEMEIRNLGTARIQSLTGTTSARVGWVGAEAGVTVSSSWVDALNRSYPYIAPVTWLAGLELSKEAKNPPWKLEIRARGASAHEVAEYSCFDFGATARVGGFEARVGVENIFDRKYELIRDFPNPGRAWTLQLTAKI